MSPIHDTDSPEERWSKAEWEHYELFEKLEARLRKKKRWVISGAVVIFLVLSALPVVADRSPQWLALSAIREFAEHISRLKREAGERQLALRVSVDPSAPLQLKVQRASRCDAKDFVDDQTIRLLEAKSNRSALGWLDPARGREVGIPGLVASLCFDPLLGSSVTPEPSSTAGFVILPVKEMTEAPDRYAVMVLTGPSAEISFE